MVVILTKKRDRMAKAFRDARLPRGSSTFRSGLEQEAAAPGRFRPTLPDLSCRRILGAGSGRMSCGWKTRPPS